MKRIISTLVLVITMASLVSCDPEEDRQDLAKLKYTAGTLDFTVTQNPANPNEITMTNLTSDIIPYWSYIDGNGNELGHSNSDENTVIFPFAGTYTVYFTAFTPGGAVEANPVNITVAENNEEYFSAPEWNMLTNGINGKTWKLNMAGPIGWAGLDFPYNPTGSDFWNWFPDYAGNSWTMANKDWGQMTFNLDGGYNTTVTQTALATDEQTTKTGSFSFDIANHKLQFNGGPEMLFGGDYYPDASNWVSVRVTELTDSSLSLAVIRDQSRTGEGVCQIVFHYVPVE